MFVYLLHFHRRISERHTCQHYIGFTECLATRIQQHHTRANAARLVQVAFERGIGFDLVRVWRGDRSLERRLKNRKAGPYLCPLCGDGCPDVGYADELTSAEIEAALLPF